MPPPLRRRRLQTTRAMQQRGGHASASGLLHGLPARPFSTRPYQQLTCLPCATPHPTNSSPASHAHPPDPLSNSHPPPLSRPTCLHRQMSTPRANATVDAKGKVSVNVSVAKALEAIVPGVKLGLSGALPDPSSAKLNIEYAPCREFAAKTAVTLVSSPLVDASAAVMHQGAYAGGEVAYDSAKAAITKANAAVGYHAADFQVRKGLGLGLGVGGPGGCG
eukprot:360081-Chlamydomonas_euryale.AAC.5